MSEPTRYDAMRALTEDVDELTKEVSKLITTSNKRGKELLELRESNNEIVLLLRDMRNLVSKEAMQRLYQQLSTNLSGDLDRQWRTELKTLQADQVTPDEVAGSLQELEQSFQQKLGALQQLLLQETPIIREIRQELHREVNNRPTEQRIQELVGQLRTQIIELKESRPTEDRIYELLESRLTEEHAQEIITRQLAAQPQSLTKGDVLGILRPIEERTQEALEHSEKRIETLIAAIPKGVSEEQVETLIAAIPKGISEERVETLIAAIPKGVSEEQVETLLAAIPKGVSEEQVETLIAAIPKGVSEEQVETLIAAIPKGVSEEQVETLIAAIPKGVSEEYTQELLTKTQKVSEERIQELLSAIPKGVTEERVQELLTLIPHGLPESEVRDLLAKVPTGVSEQQLTVILKPYLSKEELVREDMMRQLLDLAIDTAMRQERDRAADFYVSKVTANERYILRDELDALRKIMITRNDLETLGKNELDELRMEQETMKRSVVTRDHLRLLKGEFEDVRNRCEGLEQKLERVNGTLTLGAVPVEQPVVAAAAPVISVDPGQIADLQAQIAEISALLPVSKIFVAESEKAGVNATVRYLKVGDSRFLLSNGFPLVEAELSFHLQDIQLPEAQQAQVSSRDYSSEFTADGHLIFRRNSENVSVKRFMFWY